MTLELQTPVVGYIGNGVQTIFPFVFTIQFETDLVVTVDGVLQTDGVEYNLANVTEAGGDVVFVVAPIVLAGVVVSRETPLDQQVDYQPFAKFPADTHEFALDKLTAILQEQRSDIDAIVTPNYTFIDGHTSTTGVITGGVLTVNADTTKFDVSDGSGIIVDGFTDPDNPTITHVSWEGKTGIVSTFNATVSGTSALTVDAAPFTSSTTSNAVAFTSILPASIFDRSSRSLICASR